MPDPVDADSIAEAAAGPASASVDGQSATAHSIPDQIAAAKFKAAQDAVAETNDAGGRKSPWRAAVTAVGIPPGANGR